MSERVPVYGKTAPEELANRFTYHAPKNDQAARYEIIREQARTFAGRINELCPESREKALALTNLDQVVFWSNAAIARNE